VQEVRAVQEVLVLLVMLLVLLLVLPSVLTASSCAAR
jgi:hypothetical protein